VLFAGALVPAKGLHVLLEAFATLASRVADARLLIAGRSDNAEYVEALHAQIVGLNIEERVTFLGQLTPGDLRGQMQRARVLVLPSITEGLGRVLIEAMLTGTPVIGTHAGGIPEVIADQSTGLLVPSGDDRALAGALVRVFEDSVAIDAMALRARMAAGQLVANDTFVEGHRRLLDAAVQRLAQR
jgi:glycosyltransferase involved in cell wall biosynthesis